MIKQQVNESGLSHVYIIFPIFLNYMPISIISPKKIIMLIETTCGLSYAVIIVDTPLMINYGSILFLDIVALAMKAYYAHKNLVHQTIHQEDSI